MTKSALVAMEFVCNFHSNDEVSFYKLFGCQERFKIRCGTYSHIPRFLIYHVREIRICRTSLTQSRSAHHISFLYLLIQHWHRSNSCALCPGHMNWAFLVCFGALFTFTVNCAVPSEPTTFTSPTFHPLVERETYRVVPVTSLSTSASITYTPPQIWVAQGLIKCGPSLFPNPCTSIQYETTTVWVDQSLGAEYYVYSTYYYTTIEPVTADRYSPVIVSTTFVPTASLINGSYGTATLQSHSPVMSTPSPRVKERTVQAINLPLHALARRNSGSSNDSCIGLPPGRSFKTNSLADVCDFVSKANDSFVSLAPTAAAYLPSWLDYLISLIAASIAIFCVLITSSAPYHTAHLSIREINNGIRHHYTTREYAVAAVGIVFASIRTVLGIYQIAKHWQSFETLSFISPLLWVDWLIVVHVLGGKLKSVTMLLSMGLWGVCCWLCVGYGFLNYGTLQYEVLELSGKCGLVGIGGISWQTDPRRVRILDLHYVIFGFGTLAFLEGWSAFQRKKLDRERAIYFRGHELHKLLFLCACFSVLVCLAGGMVLSGLLNEANYLILNQHNCYASYVSSRNTYKNISFLDLAIRVSEWFGINIWEFYLYYYNSNILI